MNTKLSLPIRFQGVVSLLGQTSEKSWTFVEISTESLPEGCFKEIGVRKDVLLKQLLKTAFFYYFIHRYFFTTNKSKLMNISVYRKLN